MQVFIVRVLSFVLGGLDTRFRIDSVVVSKNPEVDGRAVGGRGSAIQREGEEGQWGIIGIVLQ